MATAFLDSSLRKLLFPYLEGADHEDPSKPSHWMSNLAAEALGLDSSHTSSSSLPSGSSSTSSSKGRAALAHRKGSRALYASSSTHKAATSSSHTCDDLDQMQAVPWASMYLNQYDDGEQSSSDEEDDTPAAAPTKKPWASKQVSQDKIQRRSTLPSQSSTRGQTLPSSLTSVSSERPLAPPSGPAQGESKAETPRRGRGLSAPTPLTPAQPLDHVNTALPVRIPPPRICLQGSAEATSLLPITRRNSRSDRGGWPREGDLTPSSSSSSLVLSGESDGSFYGDAGDDDPESQLAAGIVRLKAKRRLEEATKAAHAKAQYGKEFKAENTTILTTEDVTDEDTDVLDDSASRVIADNCGFIETLADIVLELKIRRSGTFRGRATSALDVPSLASDRLHPTGLPRSQSLDALVETELTRRMGARPTFGPEEVSTPASLSKEVKQWSRGRRSSGSRHDSPLLTSRPSSPPPTTMPAVSEGVSAKTLFGAISLVHALLNRSATYRYCASIAEGTSEEEEDQHQRSLYPYNDGLEEGSLVGSRVSEDTGDGEADTTAYSSLWATPIPSRTNSSYNLQLLGDERSAFDQDDWSIPSPARQQYFPTANGIKNSYASRPQGPSAKQSVSPLWVATGEDGSETDLIDDTGAKRPSYQRSWSSFLGISG